MKIMKKITAIILTMAMVIAQVSVLPFAENSYASGKGDSASYAMRVPSDEKVAHGTGATSWVRTTASIGRNENNTDYATAYIFTEEINSEKFFVMTPKQGAATSQTYIMFKSNAYNTYSSEATRLYNGIPDCIPSGIEGMAFRVKGGATASDKMYLNIALCVKGTGNSGYNYVVTNDLVFYDAVTGAKSTVTYDETNGGILLAGNADGYIYAPLKGIVNGATAITEAGLREQSTVSGNYNGYRGIQYKFGTTDFGGKTLYIGDAYFVGNDEDFDTVHAAPAAPTLKEATASSIEVNAESGMLYAIEKGGVIGEYTASGLFEGLESGTTYKVYAKKDNASAIYAAYAELSTKGVLTPVATEVTHNSIRVEAVEGQEYSIDGETWNTTGEFTGLDSATEYTITTRSIEDNTLVRTVNVITKSEPYSYVKGDGAYYALQIADGTVKLDSTKVIASAGLGRNDDNTAYTPNGNLFIKTIDGKNYIELAPSTSSEAVSIKATQITYGMISGIPAAIEKRDNIEAVAVRLKVSGAESEDAAFSLALGDYTLADGIYDYINAQDGEWSILANYEGIFALDDTDGYLILPLECFVNSSETSLTAAVLKTSYTTLDLETTGDWTDLTLYLGDVLFITDMDAFMRVHSVPIEAIMTARTETTVTIEVEENVLYSIDGGATWTDENFDGTFTGLKGNTEYIVYAKYIGGKKYTEFIIQTRPEFVELISPSVYYVDTTFIMIDAQLDHEYSIDGGENWDSTGLFMGLIPATQYNVISRIIGETEVSAPVMVETLGGAYSTGRGDGTNYMYRVPNTDTDGNALPTTTDQYGDTVEYITKSLGVNSWIGMGIGRDPSDTTVGKNSDMGGAYLIKELDGERFIQFTPLTSQECNSNLRPNMPYDGEHYYGDYNGGKGIPDEIGIESVNGFAFRIKLENVVTPVGITFYIPLNGNIYAPGTPTEEYQYKFIDAKTGAISTLEYQKVLKFTEKSYDGWVVIPIELYSETMRAMLQEYYCGIQPWIHGADCVNHGASWSVWNENTQFYIGDSLFLADVDKFIFMNSAPETPVMLNKTSTTINVKVEDGVEYALSRDAAEWNTTGSFIGLAPNTLYTVYARYIGRTIASSLNLYTDMENPPLTAPQNAVATQTTIKVDVVPGLEYSIDGENWNETGYWEGLKAETTYAVRARVKGTIQEATTNVTTLELENIWETDFDDNLTWLTKIPDPAETPEVGTDWGYSGAALHPSLESGQGIPVREFDGEFFIEYTTYKRSDTQLGLKHLKTYGTRLVPAEAKLKKQQAVIIRFKVVGATGSETTTKLSIYTSTATGYSVNMNPKVDIYLVDKQTGMVSVVKNSGRILEFTEDFDGYMVIPIEALLKDDVVDIEWLENNWYNITPWLHDTSCTHGAGDSCWDGKFYYQGNNYFAYDMALFMKEYSAPEIPVIQNVSGNSITLKAVEGILYSIDNGVNWQESNVFTGLTENTEYAILAKYAANQGELVSETLVAKTVSNDHVHKYIGTVTEPTCAEQGYTTYTCECYDSFISDYTDALGHTYSKTVVEPTCSTKGYTTYICEVCGDKYISDYANTLEHKYSKAVTEPTCTEQGYTTYTCEVCGNTYVSDYTDAKGHSYSESIVAPTCTSRGYTVHSCACGDRYATEYTGFLGHNFISDTCENCGENMSKTLMYFVEDGEVTIEGFLYPISNLVIPSEIDGYPVTTIGYMAFSNCNILASIIIPDTVTEIKWGAFSYCMSLTSITLPKGLTVIADRLFEGCEVLTNITIPEGVTEIGRRAFEYCINLEKVVIPSQVTIIGTSAFADCKALAEVVIPHGVTSIGTAAFNGCTSLKNISIPESVTRVGQSIIYNTPYYNDEANWEYDTLYLGNYLLEVKNSISGCYTVKSGTKAIAESAFWDCEQLKGIAIPYSVVNIGQFAFYCCDNLKTVYYSGAEEQWATVTVEEYNDELFAAEIIYNSAVHFHNYYSVVTAPTCTEQGYTTHACKYCEYSYKTDFTSPVHSYVSTVVPPTVTEQGYTEHVCSGCGKTYRDNFVAKLATVTGLKATPTDVDITLTWDAHADKKDKYYVRVYAPDGTFKAYNTDATSITIKNLEYNTDYTFKVITKTSAGYMKWTDADSVVSRMVIGERVVGLKATIQGKGAKIGFLPVPNAEGYYAYVYEADTMTRVDAKEVSASATSFVANTNLVAGKKYTVKITPKLNGKWIAGVKENGVGVTFTAPVVNPSSYTIADQTATSVRFNWGAVKGASEYYIRVKEKATGKVVNTLHVTGGKTTATLSRYTDGTRISPNTTYTLEFCAYVPGVVSTYGAPVDLTTTEFEDVAITASKENKNVTLSWNATTNASAYYLYIIDGVGFKAYFKYVEGADNTSLTIPAPTKAGKYSYGVVVVERNTSGTAYVPMAVSNAITIS